MKKILAVLFSVLFALALASNVMAQEFPKSEYYQIQPRNGMQATEMSSDNYRTGSSFWDTGKDSRSHVNHFFEAYASFGAWQSEHTYGVYALPEVLRWWGPEDKIRVANYGLGLIVKFDSGASDFGPEWGHVAPGIEVGYWENFDDYWYLLFKPRLTYRFEREGTGREDGIMPGGYAELSRVLSPRDLLIFAADGWYFPDDSYASARIHWEHKFGKLKTKLGVGPVWHVLDKTEVGISPTVSVKFRDTWSVGASVDFSDGGPFYGAFVSWEFNSDRHSALSRKKGE